MARSIIIEDKKKMPLWLTGIVKYKNLFDSVDSLVTYLIDINNGIIKFNKKEWKILKDCYK